MKHALAALLVLASLLSAAPKKRKAPVAEVEVIRASAKRVENRIELDGKVKNRGEVPIQGLVLHFELLSTGMKPISVRNGPADTFIDAGNECAYLFQMKDEPRAVHFRILATDGRSGDLTVIAPGPYVIQ